MFDVEISEIVRACGGCVCHGDTARYEHRHVTRISYDSRDCDGSTVFVPLIGERVDAHRFINDVFAKGCIVSLSSRTDIDCSGDGIIIHVPDTLAAMQKMASYFRERISTPVIGVTGSVGKTTTRQMIALALSAGYRVYATKGNNNSQIGVPNTIFNYDNDAGIAVLELGMSMPGEMSEITRIVRPDTVVFTNIGIAHIENLGSRQKILEEKMHITDHMSEGGYVYLNHDNDLLSACRLREGLRAYYYGMTPDCDAYPENIDMSRGFPRFTAVISGERVDVELSVYGAHNILNTLVALAVARHYGVDLNAAAQAVGTFSGYAHRQQLIHAGAITIIDDTYNASPDSMKAGIDILSGISGEGRRIAVLADMKELGSETENAHREVGRYIRSRGNIDMLVTYGESSEMTAEESGVENRAHFTDRGELEEYLLSALRPGDAVFLKGSNSMGLSQVVDRLTDSFSK